MQLRHTMLCRDTPFENPTHRVFNPINDVQVRATTESMADVRVDSLRLFITLAAYCPRMRMRHWAGWP